MRNYELHEAPADVLSDANRHSVSCDECGVGYKIALQVMAYSVLNTPVEDGEDDW